MVWIIIKNIKQLIITHRTVFILFVVSQLISTLSIMFVYSASVSQDQQSLTYNQKIRTYTVKQEENYNASLDKMLTLILNEKEGLLRNITVKLGENSEIHAEFTYINRNPLYVHYGRYFTEEDFNRGARQIILCDTLAEGQKKVGGTFNLYGTEYAIIGIIGQSLFHEIPYCSIDDYGHISEISFALVAPPNSKELEEWRAYLQYHFKDASIEVPEQQDLSYAAGNLYRRLSSMVIGLLAIINFSYLYNFVLLRRRGWYASLRICGCSKLKGMLIYFMEVLIISVILFLFCGVCFHLFVSRLLPEINENLIYMMNIGDYITLLMIYLIVITAVFMPMIIRFSSEMPVALWRKE